LREVSHGALPFQICSPAVPLAGIGPISFLTGNFRPLASRLQKPEQTEQSDNLEQNRTHSQSKIHKKNERLGKPPVFRQGILRPVEWFCWFNRRRAIG
jgi:hypothetical protein